MFLVPRKPKTIFTMFFASGSKNHSIYSFWRAPSKNTGIYAVSSTLQETVFPCQRYKHIQKHGKLSVNYSILAFATHPKNSKIQNRPSKTLLGSKPRFYPCWADFCPPKSAKTPPEWRNMGEGRSRICNAAAACRVASNGDLTRHRRIIEWANTLVPPTPLSWGEAASKGELGLISRVTNP
jgi:hypothetical protein